MLTAKQIIHFSDLQRATGFERVDKDESRMVYKNANFLTSQSPPEDAEVFDCLESDDEDSKLMQDIQHLNLQLYVQSNLLKEQRPNGEPQLSKNIE